MRRTRCSSRFPLNPLALTEFPDVKNLLAKALVTLAATGVLTPGLAQARDNVSVVGSSTVYPFATVVAERFGR